MKILNKLKGFFKNSDKVENMTKSEPRKPKMFGSADVEKMKKLKKEGYSNVKVAKMMKCSEKTVRNYLKENQPPRA